MLGQQFEMYLNFLRILETSQAIFTEILLAEIGLLLLVKEEGIIPFYNSSFVLLSAFDVL